MDMKAHGFSLLEILISLFLISVLALGVLEQQQQGKLKRICLKRSYEQALRIDNKAELLLDLHSKTAGEKE